MPDIDNTGRAAADVVVVTGAAGPGCGRAIARRFAADGADVIVSDVNDALGEETVAIIRQDGGRAVYRHADVRENDEMRDLMAFAEDEFGRLSVLVNNASLPEPRLDGIAGWNDALETDLMGTIHATRWAVESMRRTGGGSIVNISSISALWLGRRTPGGFPGYDVAKAGVIHLTTGLAALAASDNIRVNCLAPGWIATGGALAYWASLSPEERESRGVPRAILSTEGVADIVAHIARDQSLHGRIVIWWSDDVPRLLAWGDRGYHEAGEIRWSE